MRLPERACGEANAVCIGGRALTDAAETTVPRVPITGSFIQAPAAHDASSADDDLPDEIAIKGRGGTDFRPGFTWLDQQGIQPRVCLYFTDMECSDYPRPSLRFRRSGSTMATATARGGTPRPGESTSGSPPDFHRGAGFRPPPSPRHTANGRKAMTDIRPP